jgi:hypothetical protein
MRRHDTYSPLRNGTAKQFKFCNRYGADVYGQKGNFASDLSKFGFSVHQLRRRMKSWGSYCRTKGTAYVLGGF